MMQGKEFVDIPAGSWYNINKVAKYKQLTLEEAEEKIPKRNGYERWMMKAANNGATAFGEVKFEDKENCGGGGGKGRKKGMDDDDGANVSDNDDDDEEGGSKKKILDRNKGGDDDEEGPRGGDFDDEDDDVEKGDDWEHEEIFTDDDEAIGHDVEDRKDLAPEIPPPPEIKQDEEDEDEMNEKEGGLSKSGKELKKLLGRTNGLKSDADDEDDEDDVEDDTSPVLAPKQKDAVKDEPADSSPVKPATTGSSKGTPTTSKSSKGKRKASGDDAKGSGSVPTKKVKTENETKTSVKEEGVSASKGNVAPKGIQTPPSKTGHVTEDGIKAILMKRAPMTTGELVGEFKARLKTPEDKKAFTDILKRISKIQKAKEGSYVILREINK